MNQIHICQLLVFNVHVKLLKSVNEIYDNASDVRIYFMVNDGRTVVPYQINNRIYAESREEELAIVNRFKFINDSTGALYRGLNEVNNISFRTEAQNQYFDYLFI